MIKYLAGGIVGAVITLSASAYALQVNGNFPNFGTGVLTALGINIGTSGAVLVKGTSVCGDLASSGAGCTAALAAQSDQETSTSTTTFVSPARQQFHPSASKAWARWDGTVTGTNAPAAGYNVTSVQRTAAGTYTVNFTVPFSSATSYGCTATTAVFTGGAQNARIQSRGAMATGSVVVEVTTTGNAAIADSDAVTVTCFGDQ